MNQKRRYHFWRVFWVLLALYILFALLGIIVASISPATQKHYDWHDFVTWRNLIAQCVSILFYVVFYFYVINYNYKLFAEKKTTISFIKVSVIAALALGVYFFVSFYCISSDKKMKEDVTFGLLLFSYAMSTFFHIGLSILIPYLTYLRDERKQRKILEEQKMQLEVEKSQANFNFLKAQINPHFLHNTLNFLYAKSLPYSPELSEGILTLSDIMRYALSEGNAKDGKAPLRDEIEHVRNVIKINQLRYSNNLSVHFDVEGVVNGATIIPFVLITLVENAFKHGDLKNDSSPITIKVHVKEGKMYFYCRNKKKSGPKELSTGIGLDNIKKRLDLAYCKDYALNIKDDADFYTTELIISKL